MGSSLKTKQDVIRVFLFTGCNENLTGVKGTFHSPNYPNKYPDGQHCSWRITVSPTQQILLTFANFSLQSENNTDGLYVYDGENTTGEVLGVFYGGQPPAKEGIYSSSNNMFVIFKSDSAGSYTGFSASYIAVNSSGKFRYKKKGVPISFLRSALFGETSCIFIGCTREFSVELHSRDATRQHNTLLICYDWLSVFCNIPINRNDVEESIHFQQK